MKEILDSDFTNTTPQAKKKLVLKASLYVAIMLAVGGIIPYLMGYPKDFVIMVYASTSLIFPFTLGFILEGFRWLRRRNKSKEERKVRNPFWFEWVENSFSIWILLIGVVLFRLLAEGFF